jgi:hypothetical protein
MVVQACNPRTWEARQEDPELKAGLLRKLKILFSNFCFLIFLVGLEFELKASWLLVRCSTT